MPRCILRPALPTATPPQQGDLRNVSYEDSKYLGGDVAHTHLVKGLDFALLHKAGGWGGGGSGFAALQHMGL